MSDWESIYNKVQETFQVLSYVIRAIYLTAILAIFFTLYCTRRNATQKFVFIQLILETVNVVNLVITLELEDTILASNHVALTALYSISDITFTFGHWLFTRQYFRASQIVPILLDIQENKKS